MRRRRMTRPLALSLCAAVLLTNLPLRLLASSVSLDAVAAAGPLTELISRSSSGAQGTRSSVFVGPQAVSDNGRDVVFSSDSEGLVPGDTTRYDDVFLRDRQSSTTTLISARPDGAPG